jgi:hypothetical protein
MAIFVAGGLAGGAALAQEQCGAFPAGQESYACACPAGFAQSAVWGSGPYTADSNVCTAALHAGAIGPDGGKVMAVAAPGQDGYTGSEANGVATRDWGSYPNSFAFEVSAAGVEACAGYPEDAERHSCSCDAAASDGSGFVWGSSPYSADSDICTAALHGGLIGPEGGVVTVLRTAGLDSYFGSEINGVSSLDWGSYPTSYVFDYNQ